MDMSPIGASKPRKMTRKVKAPQASTSSHRQTIHRRPAPLPARPSTSSHPADQGAASLPLKTLQGARTKRTDSTKNGWERDVVFVDRNTPLGALMGRCRNLIMTEGYTRIRLHAMAAAIPHAILLLHALLDILPYPQGANGMWYEIRTGSVECIDEVKPSRKGKEKEKKPDIEGDVQMTPVSKEDELELSGIGAVEEDEPQTQARLKSSIEIDLHIGPKKSKSTVSEGHQKPEPGPPSLKKRNRPSKRKRQLKKSGIAGHANPAEVEEDGEEAMMNEMNEEVSDPIKEKKAKAQIELEGAKAGPMRFPRLEPEADEEEEEEEELENR